MSKIRVITLAFLLIGSFFWSQTATAKTPTTVSALMEVLKEDKQATVYNIHLNAPFSKETSGIRETVSTETGEVTVSNTIFDIPGRNGMDLSLSLEYRSRDAKAYNEGTKSAGLANNYGQSIIAYYDVFDANGYWLCTGGMLYPSEELIEEEFIQDGEKWVFNGYLQLESGIALLTSDTIENTTLQRSLITNGNYICGEGWSLDIPSLEVEQDNVYVQLPNGQTYQADFSTSTGLAQYELSDIIFSIDKTYGNGKDPSAYKLYFADGDAYYFSDKGELLVERDRFGNSIRYFYEVIDGHRLLTKVVDSLGRSIDIQYNDTETIFKLGNRTVHLVKTPIPGVAGRSYLSSFIDAQDREFRYKYTFQEAAFDGVGDKNPANNRYANLVEICYPTGAKTQYVYEKSKKNLGNSGYMEYFKVKERKDVDGNRTFNLLKYEYYNESDGYPLYNSSSIDELYKYYSTVTDSKGLTTKYLYNAKHQLVKKQEYAKRMFSEIVTQYHDKYNVPIKEVTKTYNSKGRIFEKIDLYEYDHRGNIIAVNHPLTPKEANTDEYKVYYSYDFQYNLMTSKRYKQNKNTFMEVKYLLTENKKAVASETLYGNGRFLNGRQYTYDNYGNMISQKVEKEPGEWVDIKFEYSPDYHGAYLTATVSEDVQDADGNKKAIKVAYTYDFNTGNKLTETNGNGNQTSYQYDALNRLLKVIYPDQASRFYKYDDLNNILEVIDANGNKLVYDYNGLGNLGKVTEPNNQIVLAELEYDENENLVTEKDGNKNLKQLTYDELARLTRVKHFDKTGALIADKKTAYDEAVNDWNGNIFFKVSVTEKGDTRDKNLNYYFDSFERLAKFSRIKGGQEELERFKYDYLGNPTEAIDFAGQKSFYQYNALGQLVQATDAEGSTNNFKYDRLGNMVAHTDPLKQTIYFGYDQLGRKILEKSPFEAGKFSTTKYYYDGAGNLTKVIDPDGYVAKQHFNNRNFLLAVEMVISPYKSNIIKFEYDKEGNTTKVIKGLSNWTDPDFSAYTYKYDSLNRLIMMTNTSNKKTFYEYDNNSNLVRLTDTNNVIMTSQFDGLNRLVLKQNSKDGKKNAIKITYDKLGDTRKMVDASGTTVFDYDELGRLITVNYGNDVRQLYSYDSADRISGLQVFQGNLKELNLAYEYDKVGRLTSVNNNGKKFNYKYDVDGRLIEELNGVTGIRSDYRYYPSGNIQTLRHLNGKNIVSSYEYIYDRRGNQIQKNEGNGITKYYYDPLSRIKTVLMPDERTQNYEYDDLNNIKELTEIKGTKIEETSYLYDRDSRLLLQENQKGNEVIQRRFTYDNVGNQTSKEEVIKRNGNLISSKVFNYYFDGFNQLQRVKNPDGQFIEYTYNGIGLRTKKDFEDRAINYIYDRENIIVETDQENKVTAKSIRGLRLISRETTSDLFYYLHNAHGDVTQIVNEKGEVTKDYRYDPFGQEDFDPLQNLGGKQTTEIWHQEIEKIDNPFRYSGEYLDEETGNYYLRARYYDPSIQSFISEDFYGVLFGAAWKEHLYSYANNNPIRYIDPTGHIRLQLGDRGDKVRKLQTMLMALDYKLPKYGADSYFGQETLAAVNKFKEDNDLWNFGQYYGIVGDTTWGVLTKKYNAKLNKNKKPPQTKPNTSSKEKRVFGTSGPYKTQKEAKSHMETIFVPVWRYDPKTGEKKPGKLSLTINKALKGDVIKIFTEIFNDPEQFPIYSVGGFNWRNAVGSGSRSHHSYGTAIDINPKENYMLKDGKKTPSNGYWRPGKDIYSIPKNGSVVRAFKKYGWTWGGNWRSSKDYMHFTYLGG